MKIKVSERAKDQLAKKEYNTFPYIELKLLKFGWTGPKLGVIPRKDLDINEYYLEENSGRTFAVKNIINRLYQGFEVEYIGENQGDFQVTIDF